MSTHPIDAIANFMSLGGQTVPEGTDREVTRDEVDNFLIRVEEEVIETFLGIHGKRVLHEIDAPVGNIPETLDGFIDIAYVALTGAIRLVGADKARAAWDAVVDANLAKVDGRHGPAYRDENGKIQKPEGWTAPDIEAIVNEED